MDASASAAPDHQAAPLPQLRPLHDRGGVGSDGRGDHQPGRLPLRGLRRAHHVRVGVGVPGVRREDRHPPRRRPGDGDASGRRRRRVGVHADPDDAPRPRRPARPVPRGPLPARRARGPRRDARRGRGQRLGRRRARRRSRRDRARRHPLPRRGLGRARLRVVFGHLRVGVDQGRRELRRAARLGPRRRSDVERAQRVAPAHPCAALLWRAGIRRPRRRLRRRADVRALAPRARAQGLLRLRGARLGPAPGPARRWGPGRLLREDGPRGHQRTPQREHRQPWWSDADAAARRGRRHLRGRRAGALGGNGNEPPRAGVSSPWSTGRRDLRAFARLGREATDEEIAEEDQDADVRLGLTSDGWDWLRTTHREPELLAVAERDGLDGARHWLECHGLTWTEATPSPGPPPEIIQPHGWRTDARAVLARARF